SLCIRTTARVRTEPTPPSYMAGSGAAALAVTTGDLSDRVEAIQDEMEWDDEITLSLALRFLATIGQGDRFEAFLRTGADEEDAESGGVDPGDRDGDHESGLASAGWGTDEDYGGAEW